jgi:hypothetical protein
MEGYGLERRQMGKIPKQFQGVGHLRGAGFSNGDVGETGVVFQNGRVAQRCCG